MSFRFCGCNIEISYLFIVVLSVAALTGSRDFVYILLFSALHEAGHLITLLLCGGSPDKLVLSYYGLALKYSSELSTAKEAVVISSGCIVNLALYLALRDKYNLGLLLLNAMPVYPLDGGRFVALFFQRSARAISAIFIVVIIALSLYILVAYKSFSLLLIAVYLAAYGFNY